MAYAAYIRAYGYPAILSVRPSVCPFVRHTRVLCQNDIYTTWNCYLEQNGITPSFNIHGSSLANDKNTVLDPRNILQKPDLKRVSRRDARGWKRARYCHHKLSVRLSVSVRLRLSLRWRRSWQSTFCIALRQTWHQHSRRRFGSRCHRACLQKLSHAPCTATLMNAEF